eukprot:1095384-Rhodomonas_salina.1
MSYAMSYELNTVLPCMMPLPSYAMLLWTRSEVSGTDVGYASTRQQYCDWRVRGSKGRAVRSAAQRGRSTDSPREVQHWVNIVQRIRCEVSGTGAGRIVLRVEHDAMMVARASREVWCPISLPLPPSTTQYSVLGHFRTWSYYALFGTDIAYAASRSPPRYWLSACCYAMSGTGTRGTGLYVSTLPCDATSVTDAAALVTGGQGDPGSVD